MVYVMQHVTQHVHLVYIAGTESVMGWVRISDDFYDNEKMGELGPVAIALWIASLAYCNRNLTDGFISANKIRGLIDCSGLEISQTHDGHTSPESEAIRELVLAGVLHQAGHNCTTCTVAQEGQGNDPNPKGRRYLIHDYLEYQMSKAEIEAKAAANRQRVQEWRKNRKNTTGNGVGNGVGNDVGNGACNSVRTDKVQTPQPQPQPQEEELTTPGAELALIDNSPQPPDKSGGAKKRKKPSTPLPDGYYPRDDSIEKIKQEFPTLTSLDFTNEHRKFCDHALQNDRRCVEWDSAWRNWMRNSQSYRGTASQPRRTNDDKVQGWLDVEVTGAAAE